VYLTAAGQALRSGDSRGYSVTPETRTEATSRARTEAPSRTRSEAPSRARSDALSRARSEAATITPSEAVSSRGGRQSTTNKMLDALQAENDRRHYYNKIVTWWRYTEGSRYRNFKGGNDLLVYYRHPTTDKHILISP